MPESICHVGVGYAAKENVAVTRPPFVLFGQNIRLALPEGTGMESAEMHLAAAIALPKAQEYNTFLHSYSALFDMNPTRLVMF